MKYHLFLIPLILSFGIVPAFAQYTNTNYWEGVDGIKHQWIDYTCRANGDGTLEVNYYPQYVHIRFVNDSQGEEHQRIFSYDDYNKYIVPYYAKYIGSLASQC